MQAVLQSLRDGSCSVVEAGPGAGKTRLLTLCAELDALPTLVLAYNAQLAQATRTGLPANAVCMTFHALCCTYIEPVRNDDELEAALDRVDAGEATVKILKGAFARVCIDEAQDVKALFVRLLRACHLLEDDVAVLVVGDQNQLIYDFDPEHPACTDVLLQPERVLCPNRAWHRATLAVSYRLTTPMVRLVNRIFGTQLSSALEGECNDGQDPCVEVRAPRSAYNLHRVLADVFDEETSVLVLVDRKANNRPLEALVNERSRRGARVHVHGVDGDEMGGSEVDVNVGTYWSAKGLQARVVVVLLASETARSATYVALTRSFRRLVLVLDPRYPHAAVCAAAAALPHHVRAYDAHTKQVIASGAARDVEAALETPEGRAKRPRFGARPVERLRCGYKDLVRAGVSGIESAPGGERTDAPRALQSFFVQTALVWTELHLSGKCVRAESMLDPIRCDSEYGAKMRIAGLTTRWVSKFAEDDELLAPDLRAAFVDAYARAQGARPTLRDAGVVALACLSFNSYDHLMRTLLSSVDDALEATRECISWAYDEVLAPAAPLLFDHYVGDDAAYGTVSASNDERYFHVVFDAGAQDRALAALYASMHPKGRCTLVDLSAKLAHEIGVTDASLLQLCQQR